MPSASRGRSWSRSGGASPLAGPGGYGRGRWNGSSGGGRGRSSSTVGLLSVLLLTVGGTLWFTVSVLQRGEVSRNAELPTTKNPEMLSSKKASLIHDEGSITPKNQNPVGPVSSGADEGGLNRAPALGIEEADAELSKAAEAREEYASVAGEFAGNNGENQSQGLGSPGYPKSEDDIHVVFSSDCSGYQSWQSVVLFHSAVIAGHKGPITQLISGCSEEEEADRKRKHELSRHSPNHKLFFSPSFSITNPQTGEAYPYMNKPNAMAMWFNQTEIPETIIALIDPDFIFLKPLTPYLSPKESVVRGDGLSIEGLKLENGDWVHKGHPAGQRFGLPNWTHWDLSAICPKDSKCLNVTTAMAKRFWDLIPPYLVHKDDWMLLLPKWVDQAPKVYAQYPSLLAEQTAYSTAAATMDLRHYRLNNYAIESEKVDYEAWDAIDHKIGNVCEVGIEEGDGMSVQLRSFDHLPNFIHYCHMYRVGHWLFNKRRYRKEDEYDQLQCETPLLAEPPVDSQEKAYKMHPGARYESITPRTAKRNAFVLCIATRFVNSALRRYKTKVCAPGTADMEQSIRIS